MGDWFREDPHQSPDHWLTNQNASGDWWRKSNAIESGPGGLLPWASYRHTEGLLAEWDFLGGRTGASTVTDNSGNSLNIDMNTGTSGTWSDETHGVSIVNGKIHTPSITNCRTIVVLIRHPFPMQTSPAFYLVSGSEAGGTGDILLTGTNQSTFDKLYCGRDRGVHIVRGRPSNGTNSYAVTAPGWTLLFCERASAGTNKIGIGGKTFDNSYNVAQMDVAYAACYDDLLTETEKNNLYLLARAVTSERSEYLDYRDCPVSHDFLAWISHSQGDGRSLNTEITSPGTISDVLMKMYSIPNTSGTNAIGAAATFQFTVNNTSEANKATRHGPEVKLAELYAAGQGAKKLVIGKGAIGGAAFSPHKTNAQDVNRWAVDPWDDGAGNGIGSGYLHDYCRWMWTMQGLLRNQGVGCNLKGLVCLSGQNDVEHDTNQTTVEETLYQAAMQAIFTRFREQMSAPSLKVQMFKTISDDPIAGYDATVVRAAEVAIAAADSNVTLVDTDSRTTYPVYTDGHYTSVGSAAIGTDIYNHYFS